MDHDRKYLQRRIQYISIGGKYHNHFVSAINRAPLLRQVDAKKSEGLNETLQRQENRVVRSRIGAEELPFAKRLTAVQVDRSPPSNAHKATASPVSGMAGPSETIEISDSDGDDTGRQQSLKAKKFKSRTAENSRTNGKKPGSFATSSKPRSLTETRDSTGNGALSGRAKSSQCRKKKQESLTQTTQGTRAESPDPWGGIVGSRKINHPVINLDSDEEGDAKSANGASQKSNPPIGKSAGELFSKLLPKGQSSLYTKRPRDEEYTSPLSALRQDQKKRRRTESAERNSTGVSNLARKFAAAKPKGSPLTSKQRPRKRRGSGDVSPASELKSTTASSRNFSEVAMDSHKSLQPPKPGLSSRQPTDEYTDAARATRSAAYTQRSPPKTQSLQVRPSGIPDMVPHSPMPPESLVGETKEKEGTSLDAESRNVYSGLGSQKNDDQSTLEIPKAAETMRTSDVAGKETQVPALLSYAQASVEKGLPTRDVDSLPQREGVSSARDGINEGIASASSTAEFFEMPGTGRVEPQTPPSLAVNASAQAGAPVDKDAEPPRSFAGEIELNTELSFPGAAADVDAQLLEEIAQGANLTSDLSMALDPFTDHPTPLGEVPESPVLNMAEPARFESGIFAVPQAPASAVRQTAVAPAYDVARTCGKVMQDYQEDNDYWTRRDLRKARQSIRADDPKSAYGAARLVPSTDVFKRMKRPRVTHVTGGDAPASATTAQFKTQFFTPTKVPKQSKQELRSVPMTIIRAPEGVEDLPLFMHYVTIKNNILAPNVNTLHYWPYFGDDYAIEKAEGLGNQYELDMKERLRKIKRLKQAESLEEYARRALDQLDCSLEDVLRFFLDLAPDFGMESSPETAKAIRYRNHATKGAMEDLDPRSEKWVTVLSKLPESDPKRLARAAIFCEHWHRLAKFSLFHVARRDPIAKAEPPKLLDVDVAKLTCRICFRFMCPYHGEMLQDDPTLDENGDEIDALAAKDIVDPPNINHRTRMGFNNTMQLPMRPASAAKPGPVSGPVNKKSKEYWLNRGYELHMDRRPPFYPCHHPGKACHEAECDCFTLKIPCEKSCTCPDNCPRRFEGCACSMANRKQNLCFQDERCVCFALCRECDADLCGGCGVIDVIDPVNKHDESILHGRCRNGGLQRGVPKHTILGKSGIHGFGLYSMEDIRENDFVGEYKGEVISRSEGDRRGEVYEHQGLSYLFTLNLTQEIDSAYYGNKIRFINHAEKGKFNLYPKIVMVNTVHRIGLYAERHIKAAEELFFDYGEQFPAEKLGGKKTAEYWEVEIDEEEDGTKTARKAIDGRGGRVGRGRGTRGARGTQGTRGARGAKGGARAGAGRRPSKNAGKNGIGREQLRDEKPQMAATEDFHSSAYAAMDPGDRLNLFNIAPDSEGEGVVADANVGLDEDDEYDPDEEADAEEEEDEEDIVSDEDEAAVPRRPRGKGLRGRDRARR